jgi:type II secretory pathway component PulF
MITEERHLPIVRTAMFSSKIPLPALAGLCRNIRHMMESGLTLAKAMRQQAKKGPPAVRDVAARMATRLEQGDDLQTILPEEADHFPPIFLALGGVAEETGRLPEVLHELEEFFELQQKLKRDFISQITWPAIQFGLVAFVIIPGLIWLLGVIASMVGESKISVFGLKGDTGVMIWYSGVISFLILLVGGYWAARNLLHVGPTVDRFLLGVPALGGALLSLALARFSLALYMTMETGMSTAEAMRMSLKATNNFAFIGSTDRIVYNIKEGEDITVALREASLFPDDFLLIVENAELTGQLPEIMHRQAKIQHENAVRRLKILASVAAKLVWAMVAIFIIVMIFQLAMQYVNMISEATKGL